ncbi:MAG TPA: decaprenylphospho-beta-D-erythro-pentofuranosid-2-ulose 2-reductase [Acidimicrobiales bacterium]|nr:decaprenylphospho-beta-D-erythro-pentofuranosid-2-ulose 2-reductase [Acidimicrobiales bacterium]
MNDALGSPQSVLVLGGTSEIARATLRALIARRCRTVVLAGRDQASLDEAGAEARSVGATTVETVTFDAQDAAGGCRVVDEVFDRHGDIDLVLVAAGVLGDQEAAEKDPTAVAEIVTTNFTGPASAMMACGARLRRQGHGVLVVLSSVAGERARRANFVYGSSKAGLDAFAQGLSDSLAGSGARVLIVRPGFVHTRMTAGMSPAPMATTADEVAAVIVRGLEKGADVVWAPPPLRWVMVVLRHLPRALFRRIPG